MNPAIEQAVKAKLLPCPFCGGGAKSYNTSTGEQFIECINCKAYLDVTFNGDKMWNNRALTAPSKTDEELARDLAEKIELFMVGDVLDKHAGSLGFTLSLQGIITQAFTAIRAQARGEALEEAALLWLSPPPRVGHANFAEQIRKLKATK